MKFQLSAIYLVVAFAGLFLAGCHKNQGENPVVSQRFIHKYGYAVSKEEWQARNYPGQVVTTLRNGVTVTNTYEGGVLHGPTTYTYPHSQTLESYFLYANGEVVKEILYDIKGMPISENVQVSPSRYTVTLWYHDGCPLSIEEYAQGELLEGQYFTTHNEMESHVEKGSGLRIKRDQQGTLLSKDVITNGYMTKRDSFYPSGTPESTTTFVKNLIHGEKKSFAQSGEPLAVEEYINGKLHGKAVYFKNGTKQLEISYLNGQKNGKEIHYVDGNEIREEVEWEDNHRHGPSRYYVDGVAKTVWYYDGQEVSYNRFEELNKLDEMISHISPDANVVSY